MKLALWPGWTSHSVSYSIVKWIFFWFGAPPLLGLTPKCITQICIYFENLYYYNHASEKYQLRLKLIGFIFAYRISTLDKLHSQLCDLYQALRMMAEFWSTGYRSHNFDSDLLQIVSLSEKINAI